MSEMHKNPSAPKTGLATRPKTGRQRSRAAHEAILKAALTLLQKDGYRAITIEKIAAEAGVGKQTIYRWWPSKAAVVLEAFAGGAGSRIRAPESGDLRSEVTQFLRTTFERLSAESGPIVRGLMSEALLDPDFAAAFREMFIAKRRTVLREILERGVRRGEVIARFDLELMVDMLYGPMWYRLLNQHAPLDSTFAEQLAAVVCNSLQK
jgi:AcrR family transcriptional regulator